MNDLDGPAIAKEIYHHYLSKTKKMRRFTSTEMSIFFAYAYSSVRPLAQAPELEAFRMAIELKLVNAGESQKPFTAETLKEVVSKEYSDLLGSEVDFIVDAAFLNLFSPSLAHIIDEITRDMRINKRLSAARWATFVHIGA